MPQIPSLAGIEPHYRIGDAPDKTVALLEDLVEVFVLQDRDQATQVGEFHDHVKTLQACQTGAILVDDNPVGHAIRVEYPPGELPGRSGVAALRQREIKGLVVPTSSAVQVGPLASNSYAGLVNTKKWLSGAWALAESISM